MRRRLPEVAGTAALTACFLVAIVTAWSGRGGYLFVHWEPAAWSIALLGVLVALVDVAGRRARWPAGRAARIGIGAALAFAAWSSLAVAWSSDRFAAHQESARTLAYVLLVLLAARLARSPHATLVAVTSWLAAVAVVAASVLWFLARDHDLMFEGGRLIGPLAYPNGFAACLLLPIPVALCVAGDRSRPAELRALLVGAASTAGLLAILTQSRGASVALVAGVIVALALSRARWTTGAAAAILVAAMAFGWPQLQQLYRVLRLNPENGAFLVREEVLPLIAVAGVGSALAMLALTRIEGRISPRRRTRRAGAVGLALFVLLAGVVVARDLQLLEPGRDRSASRSSVGRFATTAADTSSSARVDLWRIAARTFLDRPVLGVGPDNFEARIYRDRSAVFPRTPRQAHQLTLEVLAERGIVGALLLGALGAAALTAGVRARRVADRPLDASLVAGLTGSVVVWGVQAQVDWTWHLAAATIPAATCVGCLLAAPGWAASGPEGGGAARGRLPAAPIIVMTVALVGALLPLSVAERHLREARRDERAQRDQGALLAARVATAWAPHASEAWLVRNRALAARGADRAATDAIERARRVDRDDWRVHAAAAAWYHGLDDKERAGEAAAEVRRLNPRFGEPPG